MNFIGLTSLVKRLPSYADDIKKNIQTLFSKKLDALSIKQAYGVALACGYYLRNEQMLNDIRAEAKVHLEEADANAAKSAVVTTAMTSVYFSFNAAAGKEAGISMHDFSRPTHIAVDILDFELYCLAAALLMRCDYCINTHIASLKKHGLQDSAVQDVVKIASVLRGAKAALEIESIRSYEFIARGSTF